MRGSPDRTPAADRRDAQRTPTTLRAKVFPGGLDCVIRDIHVRGARARFESRPPADDRIVVVIWSTGVAHEAVRRWRCGAEAGFQFLSRFDLRGRVPARLADVKAQWLSRRHQLSRTQLKQCPVMVGYRGSPRAVRLS
jgi:hypothetical protein